MSELKTKFFIKTASDTPAFPLRAKQCDVADNPSHVALVRGGFNSGYGAGGSTMDIPLYFATSNTIFECIKQAWSYSLFFCSIDGPLANFVEETSENLYPSKVQCCMPLGSNSYIELPNPSSIPVVITCGGGDTQNRTAYGPGLEFWDVAATSSEANGIVAGKIFKIREQRGGSWWDARYSARMTASGGGNWTLTEGYGKIDVTAAINYSGEIIPDPYA